MKVLQVVPAFPPAYAYGGPPQSVRSLSAALADRGHDVVVFTTDAKNQRERVVGTASDAVPANVTVRRFRNVSNTLAWRNLHITPGLYRTLLANVEEFDIVHTHGFRLLQTWVAHIASRRTDTQHVHQPRGTARRIDADIESHVFDTLFGRTVLTEAGRVIASSRIESSHFEDITSLPESRIAYIPNGIDEREFADRPPQGNFREEHGINHDALLVLFLGRLHERKGGDLLLEAFAEFIGQRPDAVLVYVGPDDGARSDLEKQASHLDVAGSVKFTGPLYGNAKLAAYQDSDIFVLSSKDQSESFGNVAVEALACETPVIATEVCGVTEWISDDFVETVAPSKQGILRGLQVMTEELPVVTTDAVSDLSWERIAAMTELEYDRLTDEHSGHDERIRKS